MAVSLAEIGWAAGFYEGEGSFIEPGYVSITQKDIEPLYRLQRLFGGIIRKYGNYWYWRVFNVEMRQFTLTIFSLLSKRRKQQILKYKHVFITVDKCRNGHEYSLGATKHLNYRTGGSYRICPTCAMENRWRKNKARRIKRLPPQIGVV